MHFFNITKHLFFCFRDVFLRMILHAVLTVGLFAARKFSLTASLHRIDVTGTLLLVCLPRGGGFSEQEVPGPQLRSRTSSICQTAVTFFDELLNCELHYACHTSVKSDVLVGLRTKCI